MTERIIRLIENRFRTDARYFLKGGFWMTLSQVITIILGILSTAIFANVLSAEAYGVYKYLIGLATIFASVSLTGLGQSILQTAASGLVNFYNQSFRTNLIFNLGVIISSLSGGIYYYLNGNSTLATGCLLIALFQPVINLFQFSPAILMGTKQFRKSTTQQIVKGVFVTGSTIAAILFTTNVLVLLGVYLGAHAVSNVFSDWYYRPKNAAPVPASTVAKYIAYAKHTSIRNAINELARRADTVLVFTQLGAADLTLYSIASVVPEQIKGSFKNLANLLLPKYAHRPKEYFASKDFLIRSSHLFLLLLCITAAYIVSAEILYTVLFPTYPEAVFYSQLLALSFVSYIAYLPNTYLKANLVENVLYRVSIYNSIFQILCMITLLHFWGLIGVVTARIINSFFLSGILYYYSIKSH